MGNNYFSGACVCTYFRHYRLNHPPVLLLLFLYANNLGFDLWLIKYNFMHILESCILATLH